MRYKVGSLFAGIGGICRGIESAQDENDGFELVWANEIDEYACETYRTNYKHKLLEGDINCVLDPSKNKENEEYYKSLKDALLEEKIDILNGGFPCQAFSIAGYQKGFEDERGNLFLSIIKTVQLLGEKFEKPRILFLENVKNLQAHDSGNTYNVIKGAIEHEGYIVKECVLNTMDYSELPQNRERIYIICFRDKNDADNFTMFDHLDDFKKHYTKEEREEQIKKIIDYSKKAPDKYYYTKERYPHYFVEQEEYDCLNESERKETRINIKEEITEKYQFYQLRRGMYVRKNQSNVCPTLTANMGTGGHNVPLILDNYGIRKLMPEEVLKLQGFPVGNGFVMPIKYKGRTYSDSYLYKQAGNAVSVPVIKLIATEILKALKKSDMEKNTEDGNKNDK